MPGWYDWWREAKRGSSGYRRSDLVNDRAYGEPPPTHLSLPRYNEPDTRHKVPVLMPEDEALLLPPSQMGDYYFWGGEWYPIADEMKHMFFLGTIGTGKSQLMLILLGQLATSIRRGTDRRMIVFASKEDAIESLSGLGCPFTTINLNDKSSPGWDIAKDYDSPNQAEELARLLIPEEPKGERFWTDGAKAIVAGVIRSFMVRHGRDWSFADVINAATGDKATLIKVLEQCPSNRRVINTVLDKAAEKTSLGLRIQVLTCLSRLTPFAAHCQKAKRLISIREFLRREEILVVDPDLDEREAINPFMQVFFKRLAEIVSTLPDTTSDGRKVWVMLDEAQFIGKVPGVAHFATFTRSKGGVLIMSAQTIDGLYSVYGKEEAESILGTCEYLTILKCHNKVSADWGVGKMGSVDVWSINDSVSQSTQGRSSSRSGRWERRQRISDTDLLWLPPASPRTGVTGYFVPPDASEAARVTIPPLVIDHLRPPRRSPPPRKRKEMTDYVLSPWGKKEFRKYLFGDGSDYEFYQAARRAAAKVMEELLEDAIGGR